MPTSVCSKEPENVNMPLKSFDPGTIVEIMAAGEVHTVLVMEESSYDGGIYTVDLQDFSLQILDGDLSATELNATIVLCGYTHR
nr:MAG TPA: hypothetical protein [Caudoviricetes sp.]